MDIWEQKKEGFVLLKQIDALKREFIFTNGKEITARSIFKMAGVDDFFGYRVLHGKTSAAPTLEKLQKAFFNLSHSKKIKQRFS